MAISRPFLYNNGNKKTGSAQFSNITVGRPGSGFNEPGWWNGPDETLGYVIAREFSEQRTAGGGTIETGANLGFWRTKEKTSQSFVDLVRYISNLIGDSQTFENPPSAKNWLLENGYWTSYREPIVYDGMVMYLDPKNKNSYPGEGASIFDISGSENNGTLENSPAFNTNNQMSINFDGTNQRISVGSFNVTLLTLSIWVYKTSSVSNQGICRKQSTWAVSQMQGTLRVAPGTSWTFYNTGYTIPMEKWTHITYVYRGTGVTGAQSVYINGSNIWNSNIGTGSLPTNNNPVRIGFDNNGWWWGGDISSVKIYNRILSDEEIYENYINTVGTFPTIEASGGEVSDITIEGENYRVHQFKQNSDFVVSSGEGEIEYLIVGGGGGGGGSTSGGGGGGGFITNSKFITSGTYSISVGSGGAGGLTRSPGNNGGNSVAFGLTAFGGGSGGGTNESGFWEATNGGSGGGGGRYVGRGVCNGADGTEGQGNSGGNCFNDANPGGGGGGAGGRGENATSLKSGNGGIGRMSRITGTEVYYCGGGGGGSGNVANVGLGGIGGGGNGGNGNAGNGVVNTGGGGGGGWLYANGTGGSGGSGIVIIRYKI
jgi:hypothetical protein